MILDLCIKFSFLKDFDLPRDRLCTILSGRPEGYLMETDRSIYQGVMEDLANETLGFCIGAIRRMLYHVA